MELDWKLIGTVAACAATYVAIAIPTGRLIEQHTGERLIKGIWWGVLGMLAFCTFLSFYGVGEVASSAGRHAIEQAQQNRADPDVQSDTPAKP